MKKKNAVVLKMSKDDFDKVSTLLPDICPDVDFTLKVQDDNLVALGFCDSAPCIVEFDLTVMEFCDMLLELDSIEEEAFDLPYDREPSLDDPAYQKYLKYGCLGEILFHAERIYQISMKPIHELEELDRIRTKSGRVGTVMLILHADNGKTGLCVEFDDTAPETEVIDLDEVAEILL